MTICSEINVFANDEFVSGLRDESIGISKQSNILKQPAKSSEVCWPLCTNFDDTSLQH